jgi:hypothetical protein
MWRSVRVDPSGRCLAGAGDRPRAGVRRQPGKGRSRSDVAHLVADRPSRCPKQKHIQESWWEPFTFQANAFVVLPYWLRSYGVVGRAG